jgi:hypothetical protein
MYQRRVNFNLGLNKVYETYTEEEYDRSNNNIPSLLLKMNAMDFGGKYYDDYMLICDEIRIYRIQMMMGGVCI